MIKSEKRSSLELLFLLFQFVGVEGAGGGEVAVGIHHRHTKPVAGVVLILAGIQPGLHIEGGAAHQLVRRFGADGLGKAGAAVEIDALESEQRTVSTPSSMETS